MKVKDDNVIYTYLNKNRFDTVLINIFNLDNANNYEIKDMLSK